MKDTLKTLSCERQDDLISFLYGERDDANDFEGHLKSCKECQKEMASFGSVRQSISMWKDEALSGFVSQPLLTPVRQKSALAAMRQFFELSPLWLKGAVGFATLLLFAMAVLLVMPKKQESVASLPQKQDEVRYSSQQLKEAVDKALQEQQEKFALTVARNGQGNETSAPKQVKVKTSRGINGSTQWVRRPLSKAEREQLAADLRLLSTNDDDNLSLIGEKINQEF